MTFAACADHEDGGAVGAVCNRGPLNLLEADDAQLGGTGAVTIGSVTTGAGAAGATGYGSYKFTDHGSMKAPFDYDIKSLTTNQDYYVRVSAHTSCSDTCPGCCGYGATQVSEPTSRPAAWSRPCC